MTRLFSGTPFDRPVRCEKCEQLENECTCPPDPIAVTPPGKQTVRLRCEKRARGKQVVVVQGIKDEGTQLADVLAQLKNRCGTGGTVKEGNLELQGDQLEKVQTVLTALGFKVR